MSKERMLVYRGCSDYGKVPPNVDCYYYRVLDLSFKINIYYGSQGKWTYVLLNIRNLKSKTVPYVFTIKLMRDFPLDIPRIEKLSRCLNVKSFNYIFCIFCVCVSLNNLLRSIDVVISHNVTKFAIYCEKFWFDCTETSALFVGRLI